MGEVKAESSNFLLLSLLTKRNILSYKFWEENYTWLFS